METLPDALVRGAFLAICQRLPTNKEVADILHSAKSEKEAVRMISRLPEASRFFNSFYGLSFNWIGFDLAVGEYPSPLQADLLVEVGVNEFVNLTETSLPYTDGIPQHVGYHEFSLTNDAPNPVEIIEDAAKAITGMLRQHRRVYAHCHSGISRSAMVASLVVGGRRGLSYKQAIEFVRQHRPIAYPHPDLLATPEANDVIKRLKKS